MPNDPRETRLQREYREDIIGSGDVPNTRRRRPTKKERATLERFLRLERQLLDGPTTEEYTR